MASKQDGVGDIPCLRWDDTARGAELMGILNVTPDSFSDGGRLESPSAVVEHARLLLTAGAQVLDLGGESTRPGAQAVSLEEECARVLPALSVLRQTFPQALISVDTRHGEVAEAALRQGAVMINDVSGGEDPRLLAAVAAADAAVVLMHKQGEPAHMQDAPRYHDVVSEVSEALCNSITRALAAGVQRERILVDPGIGFGKTVVHNCALLAALSHIHQHCARPLLVGLSRKRFLSALLAQDLDNAERDQASHILHAMIAPRCALLRVHDVSGARRALTLAQALAPDGMH
ncbi:MAG: dihydropteroate synthase [Planctomycetota bacterium]|nr:MAG: dihydropteroate synthase [Planctomycetota bacterium]